ncbi:MAG: polysaccharide deacetylase family protein [Oscillospiraceae bacterium]|nr:polysaccharide deacetylase family protein [Oscillospiraceae bacterium]
MDYRVYRARKWFTRHSRETAAVLCLCFLFGLPWVINSSAIVGASASVRQLPIYCVDRDNKCVSLTFDAAWGNEDTQQLIDILAKYNVKATFFVVGAWVDKYPESVKALHDAGHEVMSHSNDHAHFSALSEKQIVDNLAACNEKISKVTGVTPTLFRCPYGEYDDHVIKAVNSIGMTAIQWNVDSLDWKGISASEIKQRVLGKVVPGSIILFHNAAENTPEALPAIIEGLIAEGYDIVPVSEILLSGEYNIDHTGMQYKK